MLLDLWIALPEVDSSSSGFVVWSRLRAEDVGGPKGYVHVRQVSKRPSPLSPRDLGAPPRSSFAQAPLQLVEHGDGSGIYALESRHVERYEVPDQDQIEKLGQVPLAVRARTSITSATTSRSISVTIGNRRATWGCSASWRRLTRVRIWRVTSPC